MYFLTPKRCLSYKSVISWYSNLFPTKIKGPPYNHITQIGDPILRNPSYNISEDAIKSKEIQHIIEIMLKAFKKYNCVGLSAPQIGVGLNIFIMEFNKKHLQEYTLKEQEAREMILVDQTVVINPEITIKNYKKIVFDEGCHSVKGFSAQVPRYHSLELKGLNENADPLTINASGWTARIIQHEMDHLKGVLYTDIMNRKSFACSGWEIINQRNGKVELPYGPG